MSQITKTQDLRQSHTSPTHVNKPINTPSNPYSPTREEPSSLCIGTEFPAQTMTQDIPPLPLGHKVVNYCLGTSHEAKEKKKNWPCHKLLPLTLLPQPDHSWIYLEKMEMEMEIHPEDHLYHRHPDLLDQGLQHQHQLYPFLTERNKESNRNRSQMSKN